MSPYKDDKKDPMADIHSVKIEQPVADSTIASGATDEHDIESPMSVSTDGPLSIEDSKVSLRLCLNAGFWADGLTAVLVLHADLERISPPSQSSACRGADSFGQQACPCPFERRG